MPEIDELSEIVEIERGDVFVHGLKISVGTDGEAVIRAVQPGSEAEKHGLKPGQQIVAINGVQTRTVRGAALALRDTRWILIHTAKDDGQRHEPPVSIPLGNRPVQPVHPTQIYSSINALLLCLLLLAYEPFCRRDGQLFAMALSIYPIARCLLEWIRDDESAVFGTSLSISQNVSLLLLVCAAGLWYYILRQPRWKTFE